MEIIKAVLLMLILGGVIGVLLGVASVKLYVEEDHRVEDLGAFQFHHLVLLLPLAVVKNFVRTGDGVTRGGAMESASYVDVCHISLGNYDC